MPVMLIEERDGIDRGGFPHCIPLWGYRKKRGKATGEGKQIGVTRRVTAFTKSVADKKKIKLEYVPATIYIDRNRGTL